MKDSPISRPPTEGLDAPAITVITASELAVKTREPAVTAKLESAGSEPAIKEAAATPDKLGTLPVTVTSYPELPDCKEVTKSLVEAERNETELETYSPLSDNW